MAAGVKKIAVIYGGFSNERDVSLNTGRNCARALKKLGYGVEMIDVTRDMGKLSTELLHLAPDVVFNALHGKYGEDGCVQGLLNMMEIPYTHSGVMASAIAMDKERSKTMFAAAGIPTAKSISGTIRSIKEREITGKWVLKPLREGSSVGVYIVSSNEDIDVGAWRYGMAMLEEYIPGRELTVGVLGKEAIGMVEITTDREFYNYDAKYTEGGSCHIAAEGIPGETIAKAEEYAVAAHNAIGCRGVSRSDFRFDPDTGRLVILEINTQPGMTSVSLLPDIARLRGMAYEDIVEHLVENAQCDIY